jgi:3-hydroxyisobutyrate dehydrogenase-like beta-hydroxyacid dehydrogenase
MTSIGFLGLGSMGSAIVSRLLETGHTPTVWNRNPNAVRPLVAAGAQYALLPAEALALPVSFSMLANDEAAEAVFTDEVVAAAKGCIHVNMASVSATEADRLAERFSAAGATYIAAPVLGRPPVAAAGKLNIIAAGPEAAIAQVLPILESMSVRVWPFGEQPRMANVAKIAVNYNLIHAIEALGESIAIVERHDIDPEGFVELLTNSLFGGIAYTGYGNAIARGAYSPPGFALNLGLKDLGLAESVASEVGVTLPSAPALRAVFERALAEPELVPLDWAAIAEVTRRDLS